MYKCELCDQIIPSHTKAVRIPIETRTRQYPARKKEVSRGRRRKVITVPGGVGTEIVREAVACPDCAAKFYRESEAKEARASA